MSFRATWASRLSISLGLWGGQKADFDFRREQLLIGDGGGDGEGEGGGGEGDDDGESGKLIGQ